MSGCSREATTEAEQRGDGLASPPERGKSSDAAGTRPETRQRSLCGCEPGQPRKESGAGEGGGSEGAFTPRPQQRGRMRAEKQESLSH